MSTDNIQTFLDTVKSRPELQVRVAEIHHRAAATAAEELARLAAEIGTPFTAAELLASDPTQAELSDQDLAAIAGGGNVIVKKEDAPNAIQNLWGLLGRSWYYTTDGGDVLRDGRDYKIGDTYEKPTRFKIK